MENSHYFQSLKTGDDSAVYKFHSHKTEIKSLKSFPNACSSCIQINFLASRNSFSEEVYYLDGDFFATNTQMCSSNRICKRNKNCTTENISTNKFVFRVIYNTLP